MYFSILHFYIFFGLVFLQTNSQNCLRFCRINLQYENYKNNILDLSPQSCTHIILNAYNGFQLHLELLEKTLSDYQNNISALQTKILVEVINRNISNSSETINPEYFKVFNKFDGIYLHWSDDKLQSRNFEIKSLIDKKEVFNLFLTNLQKVYKSKLIVATVGIEASYKGYFDFKSFESNVDFVALDSGRMLLQHLHQPNFFAAKLISSGRYSNLPKEKINLNYFAKTWINNGFSKNKLLIYTEGAKYDIEPRFKVIWSSLNKFAGVLINNLERIKFPISQYSDMPEMVNSIYKYEKIQDCPSDTVKKMSLSCYVDVSKSPTEFQSIEKDLWKKCDKIILQNVKIDSSTIVNPAENIIKFQKYFLNLNFTNVPLIFSLQINFDENIESLTSNINVFIQTHNLNGIEFILDDSINAKTLKDIISKIRSKGKNVQIGLQINAFKALSLVSILNNVTWVTHKTNSISDAALAIYYQWGKLHKSQGLNLEKVVIKIYPGIWKQNADMNLAPTSSNSQFFADENPENDILLNRKNLCLNENIRKNLPKSGNFINLPHVFTEDESFQENEKRLLDFLKNANRSETIKILGTYVMFNKSFPTAIYHYRYETIEIMEYKVKIAAKHGFGGIALASISDDDTNNVCGNSILRNW